MKNLFTALLFLTLSIISLSAFFLLINKNDYQLPKADVLSERTVKEDQQLADEYWFILQRKSKNEFLYQGVSGDINQSKLVKQFKVNVGVENKTPTPLPKLLEKEYWNIIAKYEVFDDPETAPYFLTLDIPWSDYYPFGPEPYTECEGVQCNWIRPGSFGLHGIAGNPSKLTDHGSSGCIRHTDEDITYLYNLLEPSEQDPIRYYIEDI